MTLALNSPNGGENETSVPEPGTLLLLGFGIIGAFLTRRFYLNYSREGRK